MHETPRTLRDVWSIAERPAISLEEIRAIVDARDEAPVAPQTLAERVRRSRAFTLGAIALTVLSVVAIATVSDGPDAGLDAASDDASATARSRYFADGPATSPSSVARDGSATERRSASDRSSPHRPEARSVGPIQSLPAAASRALEGQPRDLDRGAKRMLREAAAQSPGRAASVTPPVTPEADRASSDDGRAIELTVEELARIGVQATDSGVVQYFWQYRTRPPSERHATRERSLPIGEVWSTDVRVGKVLRGDIGVDTVETFIKMDVDPDAVVAYPTFSPELVTSLTGRFLPMYYRFDLMMSGEGSMSDSAMAAISTRMNAESLEQLEDSARLGRLIPIRATGGGRDVIIWYAAHARFLARLPRRVQSRLRQEIASRPLMQGTDRQSEWTRRWMINTLGALDSMLSASRNVDDASVHETGSCYFAACATSSGALSMLGVVPSVVRRDGHVRIDVAAKRTLSFALHSFDGRELRVLASRIAASPGELRQPVRFDGVEAGMYLLVVTSDAGEMVSSRVLVR